MGQLNEIATVFYKLENMSVQVLESINDDPGSTTSPLALDAKAVCVKYRLDFDNRNYVRNACLWQYSVGLNRINIFSVREKFLQSHTKIQSHGKILVLAHRA